MSGFKVQIETANETLVYTNKEIKTLNTRTFATNDATKPVYKAFPNSGTLVIADIGLELFNKAINGEFDNTYNFIVRIYKGDNLIAYHIVNQRPKYDFKNKTLTLSLGNEIDSFASTNYNGYTYPYDKKPANASDIVEDILQTNDYVFETLSKLSLPIKFAYLPKSNKQISIDKVLEVLSSSLIKVPYKSKGLDRFKFIDMTGKSLSKTIYKILPKHINKSFVPNIILDNRFTNIVLNAKNVYLQGKGDYEVYNTNINNIIIEDENSNSNVSKVSDDLSVSNRLVYWDLPTASNREGIVIGVKGGNLFYYKQVVVVNEKQNSNLTTIIDIPKAKKLENDTLKDIYENTNPTISMLYTVNKYKTKPIYAVKNSNTSGGEFSYWSTDIMDSSKFPTIEELKKLGVAESNTYQGLIPTNFVNSVTNSLENEIKVEIIADRFKGLSDLIYNSYRKDFEGYSKFLIGRQSILLTANGLIKTLEYGSGISYDYKEYIEGTAQLIEIIPLSISISYKGVVSEIKFDENYSVVSSDSNINVFESTNENELIQSGLNYAEQDSLAKTVVTEMQAFYQDGIRTGNLSVIFDNYKSTDTKNTKDIDTPFEIGDLVIPCKDFDGTPIITKNNKPVVYKVVGNEIEKNGNAGIQHLQLMESPFVDYENTNIDLLSVEDSTNTVDNSINTVQDSNESVEQFEITDKDLLNL